MPPRRPAKKSAGDSEARRTNVLLEAIQKDIKVFMEDQRGLRAEFNVFKGLRDEFHALRAEFDTFKIALHETADRVKRLELLTERLVEDVAQLKTDVAQLKTDVAQLKTDVARIDKRLGIFDERLTTVESRPS